MVSLQKDMWIVPFCWGMYEIEKQDMDWITNKVKRACACVEGSQCNLKLDENFKIIEF